MLPAPFVENFLFVTVVNVVESCTWRIVSFICRIKYLRAGIAQSV
jgi:hypothetical protein